MGRIVVTEFVTLDGVMEDPGGGETFARGGWAFQFDRGAEGDKFKFDELMASDALLLGRVTYEGFAKAWPTMEGTGEFGEKMNAMPKYVVSTTLEEPDVDNTTVLSADLAAEVGAARRSDTSGDILVDGQRPARSGAARARPRRRAAADGVPGRARRGQAPVRRRGSGLHASTLAETRQSASVAMLTLRRER